MPKIPQINGPLKSVFLIFIMGTLGGLSLAYMGGELHTWSDIPKALNHSAFIAFGATVGWIFLKSPWAVSYQSLTRESAEVKQADGGPRITTKTSETVTIEKSPEVKE